MTISMKLLMPQIILTAFSPRPCDACGLSNIITVTCQLTTLNTPFKILPPRMGQQEYYAQHLAHQLYVAQFTCFSTDFYPFHIRDSTCWISTVLFSMACAKISQMASSDVAVVDVQHQLLHSSSYFMNLGP
jgi:hypothetical protein